MILMYLYKVSFILFLFTIIGWNFHLYNTLKCHWCHDTNIESTRLISLDTSKDSVNIHLKSIQVNFDFVKNAIEHLRLNETCRYLTGQSLQQNCFFSYRCVYLGKGSGSIFPTITTKCLAKLAVFVIVEMLWLCMRKCTVAVKVFFFFLSISCHPNNLFLFTFVTVQTCGLYF